MQWGTETPTDPTDRDDPLLLYFTSGTVSYPKIVQQSQSYALGHIGTARFWHDLRAGDVHWTVTDTGWAKAAWVACLGRCTSGRRSSMSRLVDPTPTQSSTSSPAIVSRRSARRRRCTGGWSRETLPRTTYRRCGIARAPESRSTPR